MTDEPQQSSSSEAAFNPTVPFRSGAALKAGLTRKQLRGPTYRRLLDDTYVMASVAVTPLLRAQTALARAHPSARCSHFTLARLLGLPVPEGHEEWVTVEDPKHVSDVVGLRCTRGPAGRWEFLGLRITEPTALFTQLAPHLSLVDLVTLGDALVFKELTTLERLREQVAHARGAGAPQARAAIGYVREGVESPMESRLRMLLILAGLPEPSINVTRVDARGRKRRYDHLYEEVDVAVEYDGTGHKVDDTKWEEDLIRREDGERTGIRTVTVVANGVYNRPDQTLERVVTALTERGMRVPPLSDDWKRHFKVKKRGPRG